LRFEHCVTEVDGTYAMEDTDSILYALAEPDESSITLVKNFR